LSKTIDKECACFVAVLIMWGPVYGCHKQAVQDGMHGVCAPHDSASFNKGNILNTEVREDSVAVACVVPDAGDTAYQIHCLRRSAYAAVLRAFCAQSNLFSRVCFVDTSSYSYKFKCKRLVDKF
jgi:hypothetical protein